MGEAVNLPYCSCSTSSAPDVSTVAPSPHGKDISPQTKRDRRTPSVILPPSSPERFPYSRRLPVAPLVCGSARTFRSVVVIRSFCLRVFAFPFGAASRAVSLGILHPTMIRFSGEFLYIRPKKSRPPGLDFVQIEYNTAPLQSQAKAPERGGAEMPPSLREVAWRVSCKRHDGGSYLWRGENSLSLASLDSSLREGA